MNEPVRTPIVQFGTSRFLQAHADLFLSEARDQFEKDYILQTLAAQQGNMSRTAEVLGVERSNLYKKLRAFGITPRGSA